MDIQVLKVLYSNRSTITELSTSKISGTKVNGNYNKVKLLEAIGDNEKLVKLLNNIEDELTGLIIDDEKLAFFYRMSFGAKIGARVIENEKKVDLDGQNDWVLQ